MFNFEVFTNLFKWFAWDFVKIFVYESIRFLAYIITIIN